MRVNKEVVEFTQDSTLKGTGYIANPNFFYNFGSASGSAYFKVRERLINTQLTINGNITTVDMSRDVTFDKNS
ncbi:hypothetical protein [Herbiconiux daphne]|uniref:Uncharacterized protein n=1 Tax=Herbiconiux daphne TaxID=2970914 RepID=A0ABT2H8Z0_9MICO|nr:hypothetical protein [Herbiconiux daphne]MCS5736425.1 hypothetical protein [Herbiconiux daphne]